MHYLYIAYSKKADRFYIGETYDVEGRINKHNKHNYQNSYTKITDDWESVMIFQCQSEGDARFLEKFIKRMKSRKFIGSIISKPEILNDILLQKK